MVRHGSRSERARARPVRACELTEPNISCEVKQMVDGKTRRPAFRTTAEMGGILRVTGGYHIQTDNVAGLELGRKMICRPLKLV